MAKSVRCVEKGDCLYNPAFFRLASGLRLKSGLSAQIPILMQEVRAVMRKFRIPAHEPHLSTVCQTVPPTVMRSMRSVGWPTPTGTL